MVSLRERRRLARRFAEIEAEVDAEKAALARAAVADLARAGVLVAEVRSSPRRPAAGRVEVTLTTATGLRLLLRDVTAGQFAAVAARLDDGQLRICGAAQPGERVVVLLAGPKGACQLAGSRLQVVSGRAPG